MITPSGIAAFLSRQNQSEAAIYANAAHDFATLAGIALIIWAASKILTP